MMPRMVTPALVCALDAELDAEDGDVARVFHLEVLADEHLGVGVERRAFLFGELELGELRMRGDLGLGPDEIGERGVDRALGRRPPHEVLQREVDERALARRRRRRLGQPLDVAEAERQRTARERAHRARRKRDRHGVSELARRVDRFLRRHAPTIPPGCATYGDRLGSGS